MDDLVRLLRGRERTWVATGTAKTPSAPSTIAGAALGARVVTVQLTSGQFCECRLAQQGQGAGRGIFAPVMVGDEVVVAFSAADPNRGIVIGNLGNGKAPNPVEDVGASMILVHPGGVHLMGATGEPPMGIVHGQFLVELQALVTALSTFMTVSSTATTAPQIATAAAAFLGDPNVLTFLSNLGASVSSGTPPGIGGPPYATSVHKVTA